MPEQTPHILHVTASDDDAPEFDFTCPGVEAGGCRMWMECVGCPGQTELDEDGPGEQHGVEHQDIDGAWCVPTDTCYLLATYHGQDAAQTLAEGKSLGVGDHQVVQTWENEYAVLELAEETANG